MHCRCTADAVHRTLPSFSNSRDMLIRSTCCFSTHPILFHPNFVVPYLLLYLNGQICNHLLHTNFTHETHPITCKPAAYTPHGARDISPFRQPPVAQTHAYHPFFAQYVPHTQSPLRMRTCPLCKQGGTLVLNGSVSQNLRRCLFFAEGTCAATQNYWWSARRRGLGTSCSTATSLFAETC